jgi:hypothetical protein
MDMRRLTLALLALLLCGEAQAQGLGPGGGLWSSGPNLTKNSDGTYSAPGSAPIKTQAGTGTGTTLPSGVLCVNTTPQATTGLAEEVLATCTITANTLSANGMALRVTAGTTSAANANNKTLKIRLGGIGGATVLSVATTTSAASFKADAVIVRTGAATQIASASALASNQTTSPTQTLANALDLVVTGTTATAAGDLTLQFLIVELLR